MCYEGREGEGGEDAEERSCQYLERSGARAMPELHLITHTACCTHRLIVRQRNISLPTLFMFLWNVMQDLD